jgi:hypothetical protein
MSNTPNNTLLRAIEVLEKAISENKPYTQTCEELGFLQTTLRRLRKNLSQYVNENRLPEYYDSIFVNKFLQLCDTISNRSKTTLSNSTTKSSYTPIVNNDEDIDLERSKTWEDRDSNNKIIKYNYHILIRDEDPFIGHLTTDQMEQIYTNYPYVNRNSVSSYFPYLTFQQFKRLLRVFNITKDKLFPKHILENKTEDEIAEFALKAKEHSALKKYVEQKPLFVEKVLRDTQSELMELKDKKKWYTDIVKDVVDDIDNIQKQRIQYIDVATEQALFIYLSDHHIGASNTNAQFSKPYDKEVYFNRLKQILSEVKSLKDTHKRFDKIIVINLGDALDGWNGETTRGGHKLPQNMNDRDQFKTYIESMIMFFQELHSFNLANKIEFVSVAESNHGGDAEYNANYALKCIFDYKFPDLKFVMFEKYVEHIEYGEHSFIINHGKDNNKMIRNLPLHLDFKTELFFDNYVKHNKITSKHITIVKGDLHQYASEVGKKFKYTNIPSIYGGSTWTDANFGLTSPAFVYQIVAKQKNKITETYVELD